MPRYVFYMVIAVDLLYIAGLAACPFLIGRLHSPDFVAMRSKIEASATITDLRPRSLTAISAIEAADRVIGGLHETVVQLVRFGIVVALANIAVFASLLLRGRTYDTKA